MRRPRSATAFLLFALLVTPLSPSVLADDPAPTGKALAQYSRQAEICGPICAFLSLYYYGINVSLDELIADCAPGKDGTSLATVVRVLKKRGLQSLAFRANPTELRAMRSPFIAVMKPRQQQNLRHFVFVLAVEGDRVVFVDGADFAGSATFSDFVSSWEGTGIMPFSPTPSSEPGRTNIVWTVLWGVLATELVVLAVLTLLTLKRRCVPHCHGLLVLTLLMTLRPSHAADVSREGAGEREVETTRYDYGQCLAGDLVTHSFPIRNDGEEDLRVRVKGRSCKCVELNLEKEVLHRGESTSLTLVLTTNNVRGPQKAMIGVEWNRSESSRGLFILTYSVYAPFEIPSKTVDLGPLPLGEQTERRIAIDLDRRFRIDRWEVHPSCAWITGEVLESREASSRESRGSRSGSADTRAYARLLLRPPMNSSLRPWNETIQLQCFGEKPYTEEIALSGVFQGRVTASPPYLLLRNLAEGTTSTTHAALVNSSKVEITEVEILAKPDKVEGTVRTLSKDRGWEVSLWRASNSGSESLKGEALVRVSYADGRTESLVLPILVLGE